MTACACAEHGPAGCPQHSPGLAFPGADDLLPAVDDALAAIDELATRLGEPATDPDGNPRDLGERIRALTARGVRDVGARLLPDRETLLAAFKSARIVDYFHGPMHPNDDEAERMADVALGVIGRVDH